MASMRRGTRGNRGSGCAARARAGTIASRNGNESATPAPRRTWRRGRARPKGVLMGSLSLEERTCKDTVQQGPHAVVAGPGRVEDALDLGAIGEADGGARGVDDELAD